MNLQLSSQSDAAAALRAELELELKNKKQCSNPSFECTQLSIDGYKFCAKHILQDKNAPYKQCSYIYSSNGKRCQLPAPRNEKKDYGYCNEHALKATLARNRQNSKYPPPNTAEVLLCSLSHYIKKPRIRSSSNTLYSEDDRTTPEEGSDLKVTKYHDPFVDIDANSIDNNQCNDVLDFCSESESDIEASTLSSVWRDMHDDSSDDESIDSEQEDVLKHANVYTAEEITFITKEKLIRLQSLYVEQYRHLQHLLKERRRRYLHSLKREKETCLNNQLGDLLRSFKQIQLIFIKKQIISSGLLIAKFLGNIYNQVRDNPKEQRLYKKLKALNSYHKYHGTDAILNKRIRDGRNKSAESSSTKGHSKCTFSEGGVKCGERTLPLARHCRKHILEDSSQVLFRPCGRINEDVECTTPIPAIFDDSSCQLHMDIPPLRSYNQPRKDSESDLDDSAEPHLPYPHFTENIKTEFMHYDIPPEIPKMETLPSLLFEESSQSMSDVPQNESMFEQDISNSNMTSRSSFADQVLSESRKNTILENITDTTENPEQFLMEQEANSDIATKIEFKSEELIEETNSIVDNKEVIQEEICNMDVDSADISISFANKTTSDSGDNYTSVSEVLPSKDADDEKCNVNDQTDNNKEVIQEEICNMDVDSADISISCANKTSDSCDNCTSVCEVLPSKDADEEKCNVNDQTDNLQNQTLDTNGQKYNVNDQTDNLQDQTLDTNGQKYNVNDQTDNLQDQTLDANGQKYNVNDQTENLQDQTLGTNGQKYNVNDQTENLQDQTLDTNGQKYNVNDQTENLQDQTLDTNGQKNYTDSENK